MIEPFFGLQRPPFPPVAETSSLLETSVQRAASGALDELIARQVGVIVLEANEGAGKSELLRSFQRKADPHRLMALLFTRSDFDAAVLQRAVGELLVGPFRSLPDPKQATEMLLEKRRSGQAAVLLIDTAEKLGDAAWRALNGLATLGSPTEPAVTIVLAGRPPLGADLGKSGRAALKARAMGTVRLPALALPEACEFVREGLRQAGAADPHRVLGAEAIRSIALAGAGLPGRMIALAHAALREGAARHERPVSRGTVERIVERSTAHADVSAAKSWRWAGGMAAAICAAIAIGWGGLASGWWDKPVRNAPVATTPARASVPASAPASVPASVPRAPQGAATATPAERVGAAPAPAPRAADPLEVFLLPARRGDTLRRLYQIAYRDQNARPTLDQFLAANPGITPDQRLVVDALIAFPGPLGPGVLSGATAGTAPDRRSPDPPPGAPPR